ncbi:MAG: ammonium transporter [Clostridia bacterium]|nr:ammonium transporter [Clostridia bacterium]
MAEIMEAASELTFGVWFLIGAALVFFMQCGFAMVEAGFTRAKNAGNIIMKNLMDFCIGSVVFVTLGSGLMLAEDYVAGVIGLPNLDIFTNWDNYNWSSFVFNLVFCATAATIVSGAMAERTKFSAYCIYSAVISAVVYPIEAGWVWNSQGWLYKLGFIDYAGSAAIHMVGGTAALIGAIFLGPRIGKYVTGKDGKKEARAIPGHSITIGALGVFILWFGWYGFNGAAATDIATLGKIFVTTTLAPAFASCATMAFTWIKNGKPDVSMTLNGSLAGLVAITAGCANVDALGSIIIGLVAGIWVVVVVEVLDLKLHIDDPVGAVGVHFANGIWGTLAVGLFSTDTGLFYGGGFRQLGVQALGIVAILAYTTVMMLITFTLIKKFHGLRVSPEEEISGLDSVEHGLASAYAGFEFALDPTLAEYTAAPAETPVPVEVAVPVTDVSAPKTAPADGKKITKVEIICKESRFEALKAAMDAVGITGMTVTKVLGCGIQKGKTGYYRGVKIESMDLNPKVQVDIVVSAVPVRTLVEAAKKALYTGNIGDGKIFVYDVENVIKVRTGEEGFDALQGDEQF